MQYKRYVSNFYAALFRKGLKRTTCWTQKKFLIPNIFNMRLVELSNTEDYLYPDLEHQDPFQVLTDLLLGKRHGLCPSHWDLETSCALVLISVHKQYTSCTFQYKLSCPRNALSILIQPLQHDLFTLSPSTVLTPLCLLSLKPKARVSSPQQLWVQTTLHCLLVLSFFSSFLSFISPTFS